jgi:hypothetical protein
MRDVRGQTCQGHANSWNELAVRAQHLCNDDARNALGGDLEGHIELVARDEGHLPVALENTSGLINDLGNLVMKAAETTHRKRHTLKFPTWIQIYGQLTRNSFRQEQH